MIDIITALLFEHLSMTYFKIHWGNIVLIFHASLLQLITNLFNMASLTSRYVQRRAFQILEVCIYEIRWLKTCLYILIADRVNFYMRVAVCTVDI